MFAHRVGLSFSLLVLGAILLLRPLAKGDQLGDATLKDQFESRDIAKRRGELLRGDAPPPGAEDKKVMDVMAKWYFYRVTWTSKNESNPKEMAKYHEDLENLVAALLSSTTAAKTKAFKEKLGEPMAARLRDVFKLEFAENRSAIVNAALMLPVVAKLKQDEVGDLLVDLLNDPKQHDAVKVYAAKAMREFFPLQMVTTGVNPDEKKLKREMARVQALVNYINREGRAAPASDEELAVVHYLRREAIASLAHVGVPALSALKKKGEFEIEGPAAYQLLRVLMRKGDKAYKPPMSLPERIEAAIGLCYLKDTQFQDATYDASVPVYAVGLCFVDFAFEYTVDFKDIEGRRKLSKDKDKDRDKEDLKIPKLPYKFLAERFRQGTTELAAATKGTPAHDSAKKLQRDVGKIADTIKSYTLLDGGEINAIRQMVKTLKPKTKAGEPLPLYGKLKGLLIDPDSLEGGAAPAAGE
jgi:hypothetical protein